MKNRITTFLFKTLQNVTFPPVFTFFAMQIFIVDQGNLVTEHFIGSLLETNVLRMNILKYIGAPCLKFEVIGHPVNTGILYFMI